MEREDSRLGLGEVGSASLLLPAPLERVHVGRGLQEVPVEVADYVVEGGG